MKKIKYMILMCAVFFCVCGCNAKTDSNALLTINGEGVSREEYMIYLKETVENFENIGGEDIWDTDFDGRQAEDVAKESAYNSIVAVKLSVQKADDYSVELSENDSQRAEIEALKLTEDAGEEKDSPYYERVLKTVNEKYIYSEVKKAVVNDINISEAQISAFCDENRQKYTDDFKDIEAEAFYFENAEEAEIFYTSKGEETEGEYYSETIEMTAKDFKEAFVTEETISQDKTLMPIETADGYAVIKIVKVTPADSNVIEETMRNDYETSLKEELFNRENQKWLENSKITLNDEIWNSISVESFK